MIRAKECKTFEDIKDFIEMWIWDVFTNQEKSDVPDWQEFNRQKEHRLVCIDLSICRESEFKDKFIVVDGIMDRFYEFIWSRFSAPQIDNYGERYLKELDSIQYPIPISILTSI